MNLEIVSNKKGFDLEAWMRGKTKKNCSCGHQVVKDCSLLAVGKWIMFVSDSMIGSLFGFDRHIFIISIKLHDLDMKLI